MGKGLEKNRAPSIDWEAVRGRCRDARGRISQTELAEAIGYYQSDVSDFEVGKRNPPIEYLGALSKFTGKTVGWLISGQDDKAEALRRKMREVLAERGADEGRLTRVPPHERPDELAKGAWEIPVMIVSARDLKPGESTDFCALPLLDDPVAAGEPREVQEQHVSGYGIVHRNWCPHPGRSVFLRVKGDSMMPTVPNGAFVCIDTSEIEPETLVGRVVLIITSDSEATLKRLQKTERGQWVGIPDNMNDSNRPIYIMEGDRVVGLVRSVHAEVK